MTLRITNGFEKLSDADLEVRSNNIENSMNGNPNFTTPVPAITVLQDGIATFTEALAIAKTGSPYDKAVKNQKRQDLIEVLHALGNYVLFTSNGDTVIAKSSGYTIAKEPSPAPELVAASNQKLEDGANAGELRFSFDKVANAKSYMYQYTPDPITESSNWQSEVGTVRKVSFSNLESGKKYWCRVMAIGINGQGVYSEPISRIVQ